MKKKDIEKLFSPLPGRPVQEPEKEPSIIWYGKSMFMSRRSFAFGKDVEVKARSSSTAGYAQGSLVVNGQETSCLIGPPCHAVLEQLGMDTRNAYALRVIGSPGTPRGILIGSRAGQGSVWLASGRRFELRSRNHKPILSENDLIVARYLESWTDSDDAAGIGGRTWLSSDLQEDEGIVAAALLILGGWAFE